MKAYKDDSNTTRIAVLETVSSQTSQTLLRIEDKIDDGFGEISKKFDKIEVIIAENMRKSELKSEKIENKIENVRKENTTHFRTTIFTLLALIGAPLMVQSIQLLTKLIG